MKVFAGVDGGGTRTRAVIVDETGRELGRADHEGAVVTAHEPEHAARAVSRAVFRAARRADVELPVRVLWAGLAGAGGESARAAVTLALQEAGLAERLVVGTDVEAAFEDAFSERPGLLLIAGTGSIAWARDERGAVHRVGGWGHQLGDEGSGYAIGLRALRALTRAEDGRGAPTDMRATLLDGCGVSSVEELVAWVGRASKAAVAALAPLVIEAADDGDEEAAAIVHDSVRELRAHVEAALRAMDVADDEWVEVDVALWGGLIAAGGPLEGRVIVALAEIGVHPTRREVDPPMGAARLAMGSGRP